jgi:hypothetical protein
MMKKFSDREFVSVVLSGKEWFTVLASLTRRPLNSEGKKVVEEAIRKMGGQLVRYALAGEEHKELVK